MGMAGIFAVSLLIFTGCSSSVNQTGKSIANTNASQSKGAYNSPNASVSSSKAKNISDNDLLNEATKDSNVEVDSADIQVPQLDSSDIDTLLNDNNDVSNIPSHISIK